MNESRMVKVLVLTGDGVNCENETALAFREQGAQTTIIHISELEGQAETIHQYDIMALPGGFSFGDDLGSGKIFALKIKKYLGSEFEKFIKAKKPIIGICNGFQVLTKLGAFSDFDSSYLGLAQNESGQFIDKWVGLNIKSEKCIWTKGLKNIHLPIRHGEGRFVLNNSTEDLKAKCDKFISQDQIVLTYTDNPNGAHHDIAGVCDESGLILGLMPHPEAATRAELHPGGQAFGALAGQLFKNAITYTLTVKEFK